MSVLERSAVVAALVISSFVACARAQPNGGAREATPAARATLAAPVPTLVLTESSADSPHAAEAGDKVEARLSEPAGSTERWQLGSLGGDVLKRIDERVEAGSGDRPPLRIFLFSAAAVGRSELVFARGARSLRFIVDVR